MCSNQLFSSPGFCCFLFWLFSSPGIPGILSSCCSGVSQLVFGDQQLGPGEDTLTLTASVLAPRGGPREGPKMHQNFNVSPGPSKITKNASQGT